MPTTTGARTSSPSRRSRGEGKILAGQNVSATLSHVHDLASLIGHVFVEEFFAHRRTPLRIYQRRRWRDFSLDGDLDVDEALIPDPEGLPQRAILRNLRNPFNALLAHAAKLLLAEIGHPVVRTRLASMVGILGSQGTPPRQLPRVPSRHRRWEPLLDLAAHVVAGFEVSLRDGTARAPGFDRPRSNPSRGARRRMRRDPPASTSNLCH